MDEREEELEEDLLSDYRMENLDDFLEFSDLIGREYEKDILKASIPFKEMREDDIDIAKLLELPRARYYLLCGANGSGKHALANAYAKELYKAGYTLLSLDGKELAKEEKPWEKLSTVFEKIVEDICSKQARFYFLLENFESLCSEEEIREELISWILGFEDLGFGTADLIICGIADEILDIPLEVRRYMSILELDNPELSDREAYLERELTFVVEDENEEKLSFMTIENEKSNMVFFIVRETVGFSYLDLKKLVLLIKSNYVQDIYTSVAGYASEILERLKQKKKYVSKERITLMIEKIKKEKEAQNNKEIQNPAQIPQIMMLGGQGIMGNSCMGDFSANVQAKNFKPEEIKDENIVDINFFEYLMEKDAEKINQCKETEDSEVKEKMREYVTNPENLED